MDLTRDSHSMTEFYKNMTEFVRQLKATGEPMLLTVEGKPELIVQDADSYQKLIELSEQATVFKGIERGLADVKHGRLQPLDEAMDEMRLELGLPPVS